MPKKKSFRRHSLVVVVVVATLLGVTASKNVTEVAEKSRNDWRDSKGKKSYVFVTKPALIRSSKTAPGGGGTAWHRGSIRASPPATPGSNPGFTA